MTVSPDSFTGDDTLDKVVLAYLIIRIITVAVFFILNLPQLIHDIIYFYQRSKRPNARFYIIVGIVGFSALRAVYCGLFIMTHQYDYSDGRTLYTSIWSTMFQFQIWTFVQCFWIQLLYTFFISEKIRLENHERCWKYSWAFWSVCFLFTLVYQVMGPFVSESTRSIYYTVGFIILCVYGGGTTIVNGMVLIRQMNKHEEKTIKRDTNMIIHSMVRKVKYLSVVLLFAIVVMVGRSVVFWAMKIPKDSNIKHASSFITFVTETVIIISVMMAIADRPLNYLLFQSVMTVRGSNKNSANVNSSITMGGSKTTKSSGSGVSLELVDVEAYSSKDNVVASEISVSQSYDV